MRAQRIFAHGSGSDRCVALAASHCALRFGGPYPEAVMSLYADHQFIHRSLPSISWNSGVQARHRAMELIDYFSANFYGRPRKS